STESAQFAITGIANDSPVATLSASSGNGLVLDANSSTIQSLLGNTLTIGGTTTGDILLNAGSDLITLSDNTDILGDLTVTGTSGITLTGVGADIIFAN